MNKYFRLFQYCHLVFGVNSACIYNTVTGDMISLELEKGEMLKDAENNIKIEDIANCDYEFFEKLHEMEVGRYYSKPVFIDKIINGMSKPMKNIVKANTVIKSAQLEISSECNLNCNFCKKDDNTLYRKTGCKRWKTLGRKLTLQEWENVIDQLIKFNCSELIFFGGEPLLEYNLLKDIVSYARNNGITNYTIYTNGTILNEDILDFIKRNDIKLVVQMTAINKDLYNLISGVDNVYNLYIDNLEKLKNSSINFSILYLINRFNQSEIEKVHEFISYYTSFVIIDYIYPKPDNEFYPDKLINHIYEYKTKFIRPKFELFDYLKENNCCYGHKIGITCTGDVFPCIMSRQMHLGNIISTKALNTILGYKYHFFKQLTKDNISECRNCAYKYGCLECRAIEMAASGKVNGIEYCNYVIKLRKECETIRNDS